jgi:hypothetical protein
MLPVASPTDPASSFLESSANLADFHRVTHQFGLSAWSALVSEGGGLSHGLTGEELIAPIPPRVYLDLDPGFVRLWQAAQGIDMRFGGHTHFVTTGMGIGRPDCAVPSCGRKWITNS